MSRHDSPPSRRDDFSGMPFPPSAPPGDQRDVPMPQDFIPALARGLMTPPPAAGIPGRENSLVPSELLNPGFAKPEEPEEEITAVSSSMMDNPDLGPLLDLLAASPSGNPASSGEAGRPLAAPIPSLQELAGSLLAPPAAPRPAPSRSLPLPVRPQKTEAPTSHVAPPAAAFSLADLAGQLSSRFVDQPAGGAGDLMAPPPGFLADRYPDPEEGPGVPDETEDDWSMDMLLPDTPPKKESLGAAVPPPASNTGPATVFSMASGLTAPPVPGSLQPAPLPSPPPPTRPKALSRTAAPLPAPAASTFKAGPGSVSVPIPVPSPVSIPESPEPAVEPQRNMEPPTAPETHPLFGGQPPVPTPPPLPRQEDAKPSSGGLVLTLGGAGLILLGVLLACTLPLQWLDLSRYPDEWSRRVTHAGMLVRAAGAAGLMTLGLGSLFQRRWAPPLIHAAGWVWAFVSSGILAAAAWHSMGSDAAADSSAFTGMADMVPALAGLAFPLGMILLYQRPDLPGLCAGADGQPRWTDGLAIPGVMVFICGILITIPAMVMLLCYHPAMPIPILPILSGAPAVAAWSLVAALGLGISCAALRRHRWAWWLLLAAAAVLAAGPALAGLSTRLWADFLTALGKSGAESGVPSLTALLTGLSPLPLILVLIMARRAFPSSSSLS